MENTAITAYFNCITNNYHNIEDACKKVCIRNKEKYSPDILNDTVIQIHKIIEKKGQLNDMSCSGITNYFVKSYVNNLRCEKRYAYVKKRDQNITPEEFNERHEQSLSNKREKIIKDLYIDFSVLYIMFKVEHNFDAEHFYLYKLKMLCNKTYKEIYDQTHIKKSRDKILNVKKWISENITKDEIKKEFNLIYGDFIEF